MRIVGEVIALGGGAGDEVRTALAYVAQKEPLSQEIASQPVETRHNHDIAGMKLGEQLSQTRAILYCTRDTAIREEADWPDALVP